MLDIWLQFKLDYITLWTGLSFLISATILYLLHLSQKYNADEAIKIALKDPDSKEISDYIPWKALAGVFFVNAVHSWTYTMPMSFLLVDKLYLLNTFLRLVLYLLFVIFCRQCCIIHRFKPVINNKLIAVLAAVAILFGFGDFRRIIYLIFGLCGILILINFITTVFKIAKSKNDKMLIGIGLFVSLSIFLKIFLLSYRFSIFNVFFQEESSRIAMFFFTFSIAQFLPIFLTFFLWKYAKKKLGDELIFFKGLYVPLVMIFMFISSYLISELYTNNYSEAEKQNLIRIGHNYAYALKADTLLMDDDGKLQEGTGQFEALEKLLHFYAQYSNKISAICTYWKQKNGEILIGPSAFRPESGFIAERWSREKDHLNLIDDSFKTLKSEVKVYETTKSGKSISVFIPIFTDKDKGYKQGLNLHKAFAVLSVTIKDFVWNNDIMHKRLVLLIAFIFILGVPFIAYGVSITRKEGFNLPFNTSGSFTAVVVAYIIISSILIAYFANENTITSRRNSFLRTAEGKALFVSSIFQKVYSHVAEAAGEIQLFKGFNSVKDFKDYINNRFPDLRDKVCLLSVARNNQVHDYQNSGIVFDTNLKSTLEKLLKDKNIKVYTQSNIQNGVESKIVEVLIPLMYDGTGKINEILCYQSDFQNYINSVMPSAYHVSDYLGFEIFDIESIDKDTIMCYPISSSSSSSSSSYNAVFPFVFFNKNFGIKVFSMNGKFFDDYETYAIYLIFGFILAIIATVFIVSAQKKQRALEQIVLEKSNFIKVQDEYVRNITSNLPFVSFRYSVKKGVLYKLQFVSAAIYDYSGYTSQSFLSGENDMFNLVSQSDRDRLVDDLIKSIYNKTNLVGEYLFVDVNGNKYWATFMGTPICDNEGIVQWFDGFLLNIQNRKDVEIEIQRNKQNLELTNAEFQKAKQHAEEMALQAEEANKAKDQFLANMSHEIRTPMNAILGLSSLLLTTRLTEEQKQYAEIVNSSTNNLLGLIKDVLDISKLDSNGIVLENTNFNLQDVVDETLAMLAVKANEKKIELNMFLNNDVPIGLIGDVGRLRQVIINLINNAIKFTSVGGVSIKISKVEETENDVMVKFVISDTGIGISKENIDKLFKPFSQAEDSTTRKFGGTGLGLMISKQIVELFGGQIGIESEVGHGSDFWFTSRFEKQKDFVDKQYETKELSGIRILVVDDYDITRDLICNLLNEWGCRVNRVENALLALQHMNTAVDDNDPYSIVLLDAEMPVMDGNQFAELIKVNPRFSDSRIVMMTNNALYRLSDLNKYGLATSIRKPIRYKQLHDIIVDIINNNINKQKLAKPVISLPSETTKMAAEKRILLVEDNKTNQVVALALLKKLGYKADVANDGSEGIKALAKSEYDLVFMDCQMPIIDGFEATRRIRNGDANVINPKVTIVAMTANAMSGDKERCMKAGMDDYLSKPVQPKLLKEILEKYLS